MPIRVKMDLPPTCSIAMCSVRVMEVAESESHQYSARLRSSKAVRVCSCATGTSSSWLGPQGKPEWGHLTLSGQVDSRQGMSCLRMQQQQEQCLSWLHLKQVPDRTDLGLTLAGQGLENLIPSAGMLLALGQLLWLGLGSQPSAVAETISSFCWTLKILYFWL